MTETIQQGQQSQSAQSSKTAPKGGGQQSQYLTFTLGGEPFAIGILSVKEIIEYGSVTPVPMVPEFIRGVINLRGSVVPVINLSARFWRKSGKVTRRTGIIIIEVESEENKQDIGVMVDAVNTVLEIPQADIEPAPAFGTRIRTDFIQGMGRVNGRFVIILNVRHVLSVEEMSGLMQLAAPQEAAAAAP